MENKYYSDYIKHYIVDAEFNDYFNYNVFDQESIRRRYQCILSFVAGRRVPFVVDIGSGGGEARTFLEKSALKYIPLDLAISNLHQVKSQGGTWITPVTGDALNLPFKSGSLYSIILSEVLEHLPDPLTALKEIKRVLNPAGMAIVSVPYNEKITYQICIHCNKPTPTHSHLHSFNKKKLIPLAENAGLRPIELFVMGNKVANRLYIYRILRFMPYRVWRFIDSILNKLVRFPSYLIMVVSSDLQ
jgi:ubiquinone/menaquinone biosynthesis C-methylase UbiE